MTGWLQAAGPWDEDRQLADLRWHWDLAYEINLVSGTWTARFLPATDLLSASSADELRLLVRADYLTRTAGWAPTASRTPDGDMGAGERALRRLRDDGVI